MVTLPVAQRRFEHGHRLGPTAGFLVRGGEPVPGHDGLPVPRAEQVSAGRRDGLPVVDGGVGEQAVFHGQARAQQQRMGVRLPQQVARVQPQGCRAIPQRLLQQRGSRASAGSRAGNRPGFEQRAGRRRHDLLHAGTRQVGPDRRLDGGVHPHGSHPAGLVETDQAELGQVAVGGADQVLVAAARVRRVAADVGAGSGRGQHRRRDAVGGKHRRECQGRPGEPGRLEAVCPLDRERPGGQHRRRAAADDGAGGGLLQLGVQRAVLPRGDVALHDLRRRLGDADWQSAEVLGEVERLDPLVGVATEPGVQEAERLAPAKRLDGDHPAVRRVQLRSSQPGRDHYLARDATGPQPLEVGRGRQVVEDHRPAPAGPAQPVNESLRGHVGDLAGMIGVQRAGGHGVARHDRLATAGRDPGQQVDSARKVGIRERGHDSGEHRSRSALGTHLRQPTSVLGCSARP